ncbi:MAG: hypothetical protein SOW20_01815 [Berryella intestinalis]|uniref:hypothetical protein n=1 Tax=Berryella intestinalis TaxID=1531429 RepID=UPI002A50F262|nr:hypothetical protein [Berryella intestinalis]MDD7369872.1 hypothetical protein [Berryella intestinalis]MDY3128752.1 hypothetical protein [Berryella intestinalis]
MPQPHPSLALVLDVDEAYATKETRLEVGRCYSYVGSTVVRSHARADGEQPSNRAELHVKLGNRRYLKSSDEGADELWDDVIERWLFNQFGTVANNMRIYNRRQREIGGIELDFDYLDVVLENGELVVRVRLDSTSGVPADVSAVISKVRSALNAGIFGDGVRRVIIPSDIDYRRQVAEAQTPSEQDPGTEAESLPAQDENLARGEAPAQAEEPFTESDDLVDTSEQDALAELEAQMEAKFALPDPDFEIDYRIWGVVLPDGTTREFDSASLSPRNEG